MSFIDRLSVFQLLRLMCIVAAGFTILNVVHMLHADTAAEAARAFARAAGSGLSCVLLLVFTGAAAIIRKWLRSQNSETSSNAAAQNASPDQRS